MICTNRHIRFLKMTEIGSSFLRRSAPEIIKKMGTAVFTQKGTAMYKGKKNDSGLSR